jgi:hypothetical protein
MTNLKLTAAGALSAALLLPVAIFAGAGFAQGSSSASEYEYGGHGAGKVLICHKAGKSGKHVTIRVSKSAAKSFLRRGDTAGPCAGSKAHGASKPAGTTTTTTTATTTTTQTAAAESQHGKSESHSNAGGNGKGKGKS